jgi:hopanoid biosynthesis associated RND transporter like protein HpnN
MKKMSDLYVSFLTALETGFMRFPKTLIFLVCIACAISLYYTARNLGINTDTTKILSQDLPFLQDRARFLKAFPQDDQAVLVVVDAKTPERATQALDYLGAQFKNEKQQIKSVYVPGGGDFFNRHGLLYLDFDDLNELTGKLSKAQPFIGTLSGDNTLKSLLSIVSLALSSDDQELPVDLSPLLNNIRAVIEALLNGKNLQLSWQQMTLDKDQDLLTKQRFILLKPELDYNKTVPAEQSLQKIRGIVENAKNEFPSVEIRLTGEVVLEHDELKSVVFSTELASIFSAILVFLALLIGFRSLKLVLITSTVLLMGLALTAGFATLAVGHLNLISIAFALLYIGIGDDYAIQLNLRYKELLRQNLPQQEALSQAVRKVVPSMALCAAATSVGFFSFIPTAYVGVSELGIIAGGGILIALMISMTVLPALLRLFPLKPAKASQSALPAWVYDVPIRYRSYFKWIAIGLTLAGLALLTQVRFDFNPLNLRDPSSESVATFKELLKTKTSSPMTLTVLAENAEEAQAKARQLKELKTVEDALTVFDFIPKDQQQKLDAIQELALVMGGSLDNFPPLRKDSAANHREALIKFKKAVEQSPEKNPGGELSENLQSLQKVLDRLLAELDSKPLPEQEAMLDRLQRNLIGTLPDMMNRLGKVFDAELVTLEQLPKDLSERWLSKDGIYRIQVFPAENLNDQDNLKAFIAEVRQIAPNATDLPVIYLESGNAVVKAFQQALITALAMTALVLFLVRRSIKDTVLILLPLLMTAILTGASTVLLDNPFNFANIIVIPLLFGLGVDNGIYIMNRLRSMPESEHSVLHTSTTRGVIFSSLATLCSLVSMAFTPHLGLASMGLLLSVGLALVVVCTILVLPAFAYKAHGGFNSR